MAAPWRAELSKFVLPKKLATIAKSAFSSSAKNITCYIIYIYLQKICLETLKILTRFYKLETTKSRYELRKKRKRSYCLNLDFAISFYKYTKIEKIFATPTPPLEPVSCFIINILNIIWRPNEQKFYEGSGLVTPSTPPTTPQKSAQFFSLENSKEK